MNLKKLFENAKKTKKDGTKISVPEFFVGEIILNDTLFDTFQDGSSAFGSLSCTGQVDINLKKADVIVNGTTYKGLQVNVQGLEDELVWSINFNDVNVWNTAPIAVMVLIDSEGYCTDYTMIATPEEGEYTISIKADGSGRMMKLHGASRTYSHTAEPRFVKQASGMKDWPIKKETTVIFDDSVTIATNGGTILIEDYSGTEEDFKQLKVEVNGEVIPFNVDEVAYFVENDFSIYMNVTDIEMYSYNGGTYQVKITEEQTVVAKDFVEAVQMVGGNTIVRYADVAEVQASISDPTKSFNLYSDIDLTEQYSDPREVPSDGYFVCKVVMDVAVVSTFYPIRLTSAPNVMYLVTNENQDPTFIQGTLVKAQQ